MNVALLRPAVQSPMPNSALNAASLAVDGNLATASCTRPAEEPWLSVDLGTAMDVSRVCVINEGNAAYG